MQHKGVEWLSDRSLAQEQFNTPHTSSQSVCGGVLFGLCVPAIDCIIYGQSAFFLMANRGQPCWFQSKVQLYVNLWENIPTSHMIYPLSKHQFRHEFMV